MEISKKTLDMARIESYIRTFDNIFSENTLKVFLKLCENDFIYEDAGIVNNGETIIDKKMRNVKRKDRKSVV
jgi:methionyl-tRNA synthetase